VFISFRKAHVIGQKVNMWLRNWNFISQWSTQPFNHVHLQEIFSNIMKTNNYTQYQQLKMYNIKANNDNLNCI